MVFSYNYDCKKHVTFCSANTVKRFIVLEKIPCDKSHASNCNNARLKRISARNRKRDNMIPPKEFLQPEALNHHFQNTNGSYYS